MSPARRSRRTSACAYGFLCCLAVLSACVAAEDESSELRTLRADLAALRTDLDELRSGGGGNRAKNAQLTAQWLAAAVAEVRSELREVAAAQNASAELQLRGETSAELRLLRGDVASLRSDLDEARAARLRDEARLAQAQQEAQAARSHAQEAAARCAQLTAQLSSAQVEWSATLRTIRKSMAFRKLFKHSLAPPTSPNDVLWPHDADADDDTAARLRHRPALRAQVSALDRRLRVVEGAWPTAGGGQPLHQSLLELLESVEAAEARLDGDLPAVTREVARVEVAVARVKHQQKALAASGVAASAALDKLRAQLRTGLMRIDALQAQVSAQAAAADQQASAYKHSGAGDGKQLLLQLDTAHRGYQELINRLPHDCAGVSGPSGTYVLRPGGEGRPLLAFCDQDAGAGGWTVFQRRVDGVEDFNRNSTEYAQGFGSPTGEFWLGNEALHRLTNNSCTSLRVDLRDVQGRAWSAEYSRFSVSASEDGFRLSVGGHAGNASDALSYQHGMQFSTHDADRDASRTHCARSYQGGWWYSHCQHANLNGRYALGLSWFDAARNEWLAVQRAELKLRSRAAPCAPT